MKYEVELDAFMDGKDTSIGAVVGIKDYKNPVYSKKTQCRQIQYIPCWRGAEAYAHKNGFIRQNMLTERAKNLGIKNERDN